MARAAVLAVCLLCLSAATARELLQRAPTPAPAPGPSVSYTVPNWVIGQTIRNVTLPVGGTIVIPWRNLHGVYQIPSYSCPASYPVPPPNGLLYAPESSGGSFTTRFNRSGNYYFTCQVGDHCSEGQIIAVTVN